MTASSSSSLNGRAAVEMKKLLQKSGNSAQAKQVAVHHSKLIDRLLMTVVQGQGAAAELDALQQTTAGTEVLGEHMVLRGQRTGGSRDAADEQVTDPDDKDR